MLIKTTSLIRPALLTKSPTKQCAAVITVRWSINVPPHNPRLSSLIEYISNRAIHGHDPRLTSPPPLIKQPGAARDWFWRHFRPLGRGEDASKNWSHLSFTIEENLTKITLIYLLKNGVCDTLKSRTVLGLWCQFKFQLFSNTTVHGCFLFRTRKLYFCYSTLWDKSRSLWKRYFL